jgi:hypothetical protein
MALPTTKQVGISIDLILSLAKTKQLTLIKMNFLDLIIAQKLKESVSGFLLSQSYVFIKRIVS